MPDDAKPKDEAQPASPPKAGTEKATPPGAAAAAAPKPPVPPKPAGPTPQPWESELITTLRHHFGSGIKEASVYLGQKYLVVDSSIVLDILRGMRDEEQFDYCVDVTAVHYPKREQPFDLVWILYSFARNERIRVKTLLADGQPAPSVVGIWPTTDWLERECYDMFGIGFEGHPGLKRILLPDEWKGHPLRKEYGIIQQDTEWVNINLGIESGQ